ncbi:MAG TPA: S8 family serine peptidase [Candidatus Saccharimonadales bacterium]|nr:S8 family serine peptidase [Candidatus Saccharimonadales bacterium]
MKIFPQGVSIALAILSLTIGVWASSGQPATQYVPGDVIVTFKPSVNLTGAEQKLASHSLAWKHRFARLSESRGRETGLVHAKDRTTAQLIAELKNDPDVETAEPNYLRWVTTLTPNDTYFTNQWALQNTGQFVSGTEDVAGTSGDDIHFVPGWALAQQPGTNPPIVAVIDTGVDYRHPDLASNIWINTAENPTNGLDNDGDGYVNDYYGYDFADNRPDPMDSGFHGTHVAGIIAAVGNNAMGIIGVDYHAQIMALRASSDGDTLADSAVIQAIDYATMMKGRGTNIVAINESFGGSGYDSAEVAAMQAAGNAGIIFCCAAGNNSSDNDTTPVYPANYRLGNMIVVAATDQNDDLASFSDYGPNTVDLGAPGVNILSLLPISPGIPPEGTVLASVQQSSNTFSANELEYSGLTAGITATVYDCGLGNPSDFPAAVSNNIALIERGTLFFTNKVINAMAAGARAVIIYNNAAGNFLGTLGNTNNWIPAVSLSQADGLALEVIQPVTATVIHGLYQYLDGTSMATPQVSGAVAFAAMNFPSETVTQRIQRVLTNVDVIPNLQGEVRTGGRLDLQRIVDTDGNGLPDWWELEYFGHLTGTDPNADPDHDGMDNLAEWIAGTNPTNAASCLRVSVMSTNSNGVNVSWPSVAGKTYWLERSTNLLTGFNTISTNIAATAPTNTQTDTAILPDNTRFYRVGVEQ